MIITPVSNRFNAGLGDLPLLFPDAGVIDSRYYEIKPLEASGTPYFQDGRILLPPTFAWGNRVANAPPNLGFPGFMNINRTQDFSISLTKVWERHTIKAGFYLNHSYKAQNLGAGGGASFQGNISFANDTANPLDTGFGFANAALGVFTNYQQQSKFVEGSFIYNQVDWYVQDNWKVNSKLTLDYGLRFVNQQPHTVPVLEPGSGIRDPGSGIRGEVRGPRFGRPAFRIPDYRTPVPLRLLQPPVQHRIPHHVDAAAQIELAHGVGLVDLHRLDGDLERGGNLLVAVADGHQPQHVRFALANRRARMRRPVA
jgi:hypothetical protein